LQKLWLAVFAAGMLVACSSDKEQSKLNPEQAKAAFNSAGESLSADIETFTSQEGFTAFESLSALSGSEFILPFGRTAKEKKDPRVMMKDGLFKLRHIITSPTQNERIAGEDPFNFEENYGVYEWSPNDQEFFQTNEIPVDYIEIHFPTDGSPTNDATFLLEEYEETYLQSDFSHEPTRILASLSIDDSEVASLDLSASYNEDDDVEIADITYEVIPYALTISYDNSGNTQTSFSETLSKSGNIIISWGILATWGNGKEPDEFGDSNPTAIAGYVQLYNVRIDAAISVVGDEPSIVITVTVNGALAGNIGVDVDDFGNETVFIYYTDGTSEPLDTALGDLAAEIEGLLSDL
jgi:hypothetical protein